MKMQPMKKLQKLLPRKKPEHRKKLKRLPLKLPKLRKKPKRLPLKLPKLRRKLKKPLPRPKNRLPYPSMQQKLQI